MDSKTNAKAPARGKPRAWYSPPRTLNTLMSAVALSGLAFGALAQRPGGPTPGRPPVLTPPPDFVTTPVPARPPAGPPDHFLVAPREGLDPRFVVAAPPGIDDGIIAPTPHPVAAPATWSAPGPGVLIVPAPKR